MEKRLYIRVLQSHLNFFIRIKSKSKFSSADKTCATVSETSLSCSFIAWTSSSHTESAETFPQSVLLLLWRRSLFLSCILQLPFLCCLCRTVASDLWTISCNCTPLSDCSAPYNVIYHILGFCIPWCGLRISGTGFTIQPHWISVSKSSVLGIPDSYTWTPYFKKYITAKFSLGVAYRNSFFCSTVLKTSSSGRKCHRTPTF